MFVQQEDRTKGVWIKYHVASGDIIDTSHKRYDGVDEIDPITKRELESPPSFDPLDGFR